MNETLEIFCTIVEEEAERQENVLAVCRGQREAILAHDVASIEAKTTALEILIQDAIRAEGDRLRALRRVAEQLGFRHEPHTMTELRAVVPEPWRSRLGDAQRRLQSATGEIRGLVRSSARVLRLSLRIVGRCLGALDQCVGAANGTYDYRGTESSVPALLPTLLDQKG